MKIGAECLVDKNLRRTKIIFHSDSQAAIRAVSAVSANSRLVEECRGALNRLGETHDVSLEWVPGHSDIPGNEKADELARGGAGSSMLGPEPFCGIALASIKLHLEKWARRMHLTSWRKVKTQKHSKLFLDKPDRKQARELLRLSRLGLRETVAITTGHAGFRKHLHTMGLADSPLCRVCGIVAETPFHLVCECLPLARVRYQRFGLAEIKEPRKVPQMSPVGARDFLRDLKLL